MERTTLDKCLDEWTLVKAMFVVYIQKTIATKKPYKCLNKGVGFNHG